MAGLARPALTMPDFDQEQVSALPDWEPLAPTVTEKIQGILEAAEQAAAEIRRETEAQARRRERESEELLGEVDEGLRRLTTTTDALAAQLRHEFDEMIKLLRRPGHAPSRSADAVVSLAAGPPRSPPAAGAEPTPRAARRERARPAESPVPETIASPTPVTDPTATEHASAPASNAGGDAAAGTQRLTPERQVAIQMALAGRTREEVEERLQEGFGLENVAAILDGVFGKQRAS